MPRLRGEPIILRITMIIIKSKEAKKLFWMNNNYTAPGVESAKELTRKTTKHKIIYFCGNLYFEFPLLLIIIYLHIFLSFLKFWVPGT